jgi:hypothetical protein
MKQVPGETAQRIRAACDEIGDGRITLRETGDPDPLHAAHAKLEEALGDVAESWAAAAADVAAAQSERDAARSDMEWIYEALEQTSGSPHDAAWSIQHLRGELALLRRFLALAEKEATPESPGPGCGPGAHEALFEVCRFGETTVCVCGRCGLVYAKGVP